MYQLYFPLRQCRLLKPLSDLFIYLFLYVCHRHRSHHSRKYHKLLHEGLLHEILKIKFLVFFLNLEFFLVRGLNVFSLEISQYYLWQKITFCAQVTVLKLVLIFGTHIYDFFFLQVVLFRFLEFDLVCLAFSEFSFNSLVLLRKNRSFASMTSQIAIESSYFATTSYV